MCTNANSCRAWKTLQNIWSQKSASIHRRTDRRNSWKARRRDGKFDWLANHDWPGTKTGASADIVDLTSSAHIVMYLTSKRVNILRARLAFCTNSKISSNCWCFAIYTWICSFIPRRTSRDKSEKSYLWPTAKMNRKNCINKQIPSSCVPNTYDPTSVSFAQPRTGLEN